MKTRTRKPVATGKRTTNPLRVDPSRTIGLLRPLASKLKARFARLKVKIWHLLVTEDAFVLARPTANTRWAFSTDPEKVKAFKEWLRAELGKEFLTASDAELWRAYAEQGMKKGLARAFDDTKRSDATLAAGAEKLDFYAGTRDEFLRSAFQQPVAVEKVQLLAGRSFGDLEGVTDAMATTMGRTLTDGLVQGKGPREIARDLNQDVDGIGQRRALMIARTEIVRAHAEGQLVALDKLGVKEIGVMVEWSTAGDDRVCVACSEMEGKVFTIEDAQGQIPLHPNCRCAWIPAGVGEDQTPETDRDADREETPEESTPDEEKTASQPDEDAEAQEKIATIAELDAQHAQAQEEMHAAYLAGDREGQQEAQDRADGIMDQIRPEGDWLNEHGWVWTFEEGWHKDPVGNVFDPGQPRDEVGRWATAGGGVNPSPSRTREQINHDLDMASKRADALTRQRRPWAEVQAAQDEVNRLEYELRAHGRQKPVATEPRQDAPVDHGVLTREELRKQLGDGTGPDRAANMRAIMRKHAVDAGEVMVHGMSQPEPMKTITIDGVKVMWSAKSKNVARSLADLVTHDHPDPLWQANEGIVFTPQRNKDDAHWEKTYGIPGFQSAASGGDGTVCVYNNNHMDAGTFAHEAGHNLATKEWGHTEPTSTSAYGKAQKRERPVSEYGGKSKAEDFAEACKMYVRPEKRAELARKFPAKHAALKDLLGD